MSIMVTPDGFSGKEHSIMIIYCIGNCFSDCRGCYTCITLSTVYKNDNDIIIRKVYDLNIEIKYFLPNIIKILNKHNIKFVCWNFELNRQFSDKFYYCITQTAIIYADYIYFKSGYLIRSEISAYLLKSELINFNKVIL